MLTKLYMKIARLFAQKVERQERIWSADDRRKLHEGGVRMIQRNREMFYGWPEQ